MTIKIALIALLAVTAATPALAQSRWQLQTDEAKARRAAAADARMLEEMNRKDAEEAAKKAAAASATPAPAQQATAPTPAPATAAQ